MLAMPMDVLARFPVRKSKNQKQAFRDAVQAYASNLGYQVAEEKGSFGCRNLVIGDPESAKYLVTAHYAPCARMPIPNLIMPCSFLLFLGYQILVSLVLLLPPLIPALLAGVLLDSNDTVFYVWYVFFWVNFILLLFGPANKHNANDNTSGVITLIEVYHALPVDLRNQVCFVFFDNEEKGVIGSAQFRKKYKKETKDKLLINYDCVSDGDYFLLGISKKANQKYHVALAQAFTSDHDKTVMLENLKKVYYPSDQAGYPMAIAVAALKHSKIFGYYMDRIHTKRDTVFDQRNIHFLTERTVQLIENI